MKLDYLSEGNQDCPLLRLFGYTISDVELLREACRRLASRVIAEFALHALEWVELQDDIEFIWRATDKDIGVRLPGNGREFVLAYSDEAWLEVEGKLEHFADGRGGFNWLTMEGEVRVLITSDRDGLW